MRGNGLVESGGNSSIPTLHMTTQLINVENKNGVAVVSSRVVAEDFGKRHSHVCDAIRNLTAENSEVKNMFIESTYKTDRGRTYKELIKAENSALFIESQYLDSKGKEQLEYLLTRDGFSLLVYGTFENPLFLAKNVAEWIEQANTTLMVNKVDEEEKVKLAITQNVTPSHGGVRSNTEAWFLTEDGLYEVLMQSRKPIANG